MKCFYKLTASEVSEIQKQYSKFDILLTKNSPYMDMVLGHAQRYVAHKLFTDLLDAFEDAVIAEEKVHELVKELLEEVPD